MGVSRRILAVSVATLTAGSAFTSPADAATSTDQLSSAPVAGHATGQSAVSGPAGQRVSMQAESGAQSPSDLTRRAGVTDLREVLNQMPVQVQFLKGEDHSTFNVASNGRWTGSMWVPWVGNNGEMGKSITISWGGRIRYWVFQDYWNTTDQVRYSTANSYQNSLPVPGTSTGAGRKRLVLQSNGTLSMQNSG
jgi:hypothetical protein